LAEGGQVVAVGYTLRFRTKEGRDKDFEAFILRMVEVVKANDAGCLNYELYRSVDDPRAFAFFERWASEEDVKAHAAKPHFKEFEKMGEMLEGRPEMIKHAD
jgi:quinol monooxygenase YgiN